MYKKASIGASLINIGEQIGSGLTSGIAEKVSKNIATSAFDAFVDSRKVAKGLEQLKERPDLLSQFNEINLMQNVGIEPKHFKELQEIKNKALEYEKLKNEVDKQNTLFGKLSRTSVGQFLGPMATGTAAAIGAGALMSTGNTISNLSIGNPIDNMLLERNLREIVKIKPMLASFDKSLLLDYYKLIYKSAPTAVANNIRVVADLLERAVNYGGIDHNLMRELADTERALRDPLKSSMDKINFGHNLMR